MHGDYGKGRKSRRWEKYARLKGLQLFGNAVKGYRKVRKEEEGRYCACEFT
jgi:hypothetical protein